MSFDAYNSMNTMVSQEKRKSRNENEKKRRDQFNSLIDELSRLHNHEHKKDKSTILLDTLNFFKNNSTNSNFEIFKNFRLKLKNWIYQFRQKWDGSRLESTVP